MSVKTIEGFRLSVEQQRQWRLRQEISPLAAAVFRVPSGIECQAIESAFDELVRRHESLRTRFESLPGMDLPIQVIEEGTGYVFEVVDLEAEGLSTDEFVGRELDSTFDDEGPSLRVRLAPIQNDDAILAVTANPLLVDLTSIEVLVREACGLAMAGEMDGEPLQFVQYSEWQNELLEAPEDDEGPRYWEKEHGLRRGVSFTILKSVKTGGTEQVSLRLSRELSGAIGSTSNKLGTTPRFLLLAAWSVLLRNLTGSNVFVVDVSCSGRKFKELECVVGPLSRFLPLRVELSLDRTLVRTVERVSLAITEHENWGEYFIPTADEVKGGLGFDFHQFPAEFQVGDIRLRRIAARWITGEFALRLSVMSTDDYTDLQLHYEPEQMSGDTARLWLERCEVLVRDVLERPHVSIGELNLLSETDHALMMSVHETVKNPMDGESMASLFRAQVERTPEKLAVTCAETDWTFRDAQQRSQALAHRLYRSGLRPGGALLVALERSAWQLLAPWVAMEVGAVFVPMDARQPADRLRSMIEDLAGPGTVLLTGRLVAATLKNSQTPVVICELEDVVQDLPADTSDFFSCTAPPAAVIYTIFTSGSTGRPKGVAVTHAAVANLLVALERVVYADVRPEEGTLRVGVNSPLTFDASVKQWGQLVHGRTLVPVPEEVRLEGKAFLAWLERARLDVLDITPSQLELLLEAGFLEPSYRGRPRRLLVGGEALEEKLWRRLAALEDMRSFNVYGPTETTVDVTVQPIAGERPVLGLPLANVRVHVVDEGGHRVPPGVPGELWVGGVGVAVGYVQGSRQTAVRFVPDAFEGEVGARLYRTGDRVRMLPDGRLEYLGRLDRQVKLRGIRLEPGEIESVLQEHASVKQASVVVREDAPGAVRLVAYVTPRRSSSVEGYGERRRRLSNGLVLAEQNRNETEYLYEEIFVQRSYAQHGIRLPDDAVVLDVGANIGMYTLFVHRECARPRVYAFEPIEEIYQTLETNVSAYAGFGGEVKLFRHGLSDTERRERFTYYPRYSMMSGQSRYARPESEVEVVKRFLENQRAEGVEGAEALLAEAKELLEDRFAGREVEVRLRRLSDVLREESINHVDLLKVDVQRAERDVLEGLAPEDWERIDQVVMEVHDAAGEESEGRAKELRSYLQAKGFRVVVEQDELLVGTDRYNLYAAREVLREAQRTGEPSALFRALEKGAAGAEISLDELREHVQSRLPDYMMPSSIVVLERLPLTRHGKVDRAALPAPEEVVAIAHRDVNAPRTPIEEVLASIFSDVLGVERCDVEESFFDLGGHSLLATQLASRVREAFQVELPLRTLFEAPSVEQLARRVERQMSAGESLEVPPIEPLNREGYLPLSFAQQRLWFMHQVEPQSAAYNIPAVLRLQGRWKKPLLDQTVRLIVRRHEVLRTRFESGTDGPIQCVEAPGDLTAPVIDLTKLKESDRQVEVKYLAVKEARRPFDLKRGPVLRVSVARLQNDDHVVLKTMHHIVSDGWSTGVLVREVERTYQDYSAGQPSSLPELGVQYGDFAQWQRSCLEGGVLEPHLEYWRRQLAGAPERLALPREKDRASEGRLRGESHAFRVNPDISRKIHHLGQKESVTLFMILLAAFYLLLRKWTGQDDLVVGTDIAGRNRAETEGLIGFFINHLVLRVDLSDNPTFREFLAHVREVTLEAYAHQDLPFDLLVRHLKPKRELSRMPLFDVLFVLQNNRRYELQLPGLDRSQIEVSLATSKFDLALFLRESGESISGSVKYNPGVFAGTTVARMAEHFQRTLECVVEQPDIPIHQLEVVNKMESRERWQSKLRNLKRSRDRSHGRGGPVEMRTLTEGASLPFVFQASAPDLDAVGWLQNNEELVTERLSEHGALLFRSFNLASVAEFEDFARAASQELYGDYGDLPREQEGEQVYESTPYPPDQTILFHNESSHMHCWPLRQFFFCAQPAVEGGETPIVDCREIYRRLPAGLRDTFEKKHITYVRNFVDGLDVTWRDFFHTDNRSEVEEICGRAGIECHWRGEVLQTRKRARAVARHPKTGDMIFFNQLQLHHPACLTPEVRESMLSIFGEENFPRNVFFGDSTPIDDWIVEEILSLYWKCSVSFPWRKGDVVMVDNMLCAHARNPYRGARKIVVAMGDMFQDDELSA